MTEQQSQAANNHQSRRSLSADVADTGISALRTVRNFGTRSRRKFATASASPLRRAATGPGSLQVSGPNKRHCLMRLPAFRFRPPSPRRPPSAPARACTRTGKRRTASHCAHRSNRGYCSRKAEPPASSDRGVDSSPPA